MRRFSTAVVASVAVVALAATVSGLVVGQRAARTQAVQEEAIADGFTEESGALPDPSAAGTPVPTTAAVAETPGSDWCTPDQAVLLLGSADAATGHRTLSVTLMNFSEGPCVVEGYPDFAFGDQNGNALAVALERGGSWPVETDIVEGASVAVTAWELLTASDSPTP